MKEKTFLDACIDGDLELVRTGLKTNNPTLQRLLSLRFACEWGHLDIIRLIMEDERVDPSAHNNWALVHSMESDKQESIDVLLEDDRVVAGCIKYNQSNAAFKTITDEDQKRIFEEKPHMLV